MLVKQYKAGRRFMGKVDYEADLLEFIERFAREKRIQAGYFQALGAVKQAVIGFYNQETRAYDNIEFTEDLEIANCLGTFSVKDGETAIHAHITLADAEGRAFGGHLMYGTIVFAGEFWVEEFDGEPLERGIDKDTGLTLWVK